MKHSKPQPTLFSLQQCIIDLALIDRNHHLAKHERNENDIEHSFAVAMLCWFIHDKYKVDLNLEKILKYALIHDFPERYAGDINTYADKEARARKVELEKAATIRLSKEFEDFPGLVENMNGYESKLDEEATFVWTVDKMQGLILGDMDDWRPYKKIGISYDRFIAKHAEQLAMSSPHCREIFEAVADYCETTYYDRPKA